MPPDVALLIWFVLLIALIRFDPAKEPGTSWALWIPVIWISIAASRLPSQWLGLDWGQMAAQAFQQGNPVDRLVWTGMIVLAFVVLFTRGLNASEFVSKNLALSAYAVFGLASIFWSDFAFIAFKRYFRDLGGYLVVLIVLTDPRTVAAIRTVLRRIAYLLIPLSIVLTKYFIYLSRTYDAWSGAVQFVGVTTSKNMLGVLCLVSGIFFFWDTLTRWPERKTKQVKRIIWVNLAFIAMTLWLLAHAHSATSTVCLGLGCFFIALAEGKFGKRHPVLLQLMAPGAFFMYLFLALGLGMSGTLNEMVGRKANFTDRTKIWRALLGMHTNILLGTGYQSFWLGSRLNYLWNLPGLHVNEAHNGFLGIYLDLGLIGVFLLVAVLAAFFRNICRRMKSVPALGSLGFGFWVAVVFHNVTEESMGGNGILWLTLIMLGMAFTIHGEDTAQSPDSALAANIHSVNSTGELVKIG